MNRAGNAITFWFRDKQQHDNLQQIEGLGSKPTCLLLSDITTAVKLDDIVACRFRNKRGQLVCFGELILYFYNLFTGMDSRPGEENICNSSSGRRFLSSTRKFSNQRRHWFPFFLKNKYNTKYVFSSDRIHNHVCWEVHEPVWREGGRWHGSGKI